MTPDLFADQPTPHRQPQWIAESALLLPDFVSIQAMPPLLKLLRGVLRQAPARHFQVPGGGRMSVRSSSCGALGWVSDLAGYRYTERDPLSGRPWPALAEPLMTLAQAAAAGRVFPLLCRTAVCSTSMHRAIAWVCMLIRMSGISASRSSPCHWVCRPFFSGEVCGGEIRYGGSACCMGMFWSGVGRQGGRITGWHPWRAGCIRCWASGG